MGEKCFRPWTPDQSYLLPPSPRDWLPPEHLAYFVLEVVNELDLSKIEEQIQRKDPRGERPYAPGMMTSLLIYGYCVGEYSSRRIARATWEDIAFCMISGGEHPHFTTINQFRLEHGESLAGLFVEVLQLCQRAGLVRLGKVALDGAKIKAAASKHKAMSYQRMKSDEQRLRAEVEELLKRGKEKDEEEDRLYGAGQDRQDLPAELARREQRLERIRAAKAELEQEAAAARVADLQEQAEVQRAKEGDESYPEHERKRSGTRAAKAEEEARKLRPTKEDKEREQPELPLHRVASDVEGKPKDAAQRNFTDPDSRIMVKDGAFIQGYNAQIVVDETAQVILAHGVSNQSPDQQYLMPMIERTREIHGQFPAALLADSGYFSKDNVEYLQAKGIDPYIAVGREGATEPRPEEDCTPARRVRTLMAEKLKNGDGKAIYARRKSIVEPVFGQIEQARGFRRFSQRGQQKVRREWAWVCLTHNVLKLFRHSLGGWRTQVLSGA